MHDKDRNSAHGRTHDGHDRESGGRPHDHGRGEHAHTHDHGRGAHAHGPEGASKIEAVLAYALAHNEQHAEELVGLAQKLRQTGLDDAAAALDAAGADFRRGAEGISEALRLLKGVE
jgi:hypothetical protein